MYITSLDAKSAQKIADSIMQVIPYQTKNKAGFTLEAYYDAVIRAGVYYGFPVIDMRRFTGIHEENHELYLEDKVHPNRAGYEKIEKVLEKGMKEILHYAGYEV